MGKKFPVNENTGNLEILPKHGGKHFVRSSCRFTRLKVKDIAIFTTKISIFLLDAGYHCQVSFVYVIVSHWHREKWRLDRGNTGNLKIQFEWGPCSKRVPYIQLKLAFFSRFKLTL